VTSPNEANATSTLAELRVQLRPLLLAVPLLTVLTGVLFPALLAALARPLFPHQANGSLLTHKEATVGSDLIGQEFSGAHLFHSRPSAARASDASDQDPGYDATASGGSNLGPSNPDLLKDIRQRIASYRSENNLSDDIPVPIDAVTSSGSGLDPHISPENAALQIARVADKRGLSPDEVRSLVAEHTQGPQLGFLGAPRVNVLLLNLALERKAPLPHPTSAH
jgi:potassium-transporting ATPase KdpC subunit